MIKSNFKLRDLVVEPDFQKFQDEIAIATNAAVITVDYSGTPLTRHSSCSSFCSKIRQDKAYGPLCEKCDSRGGVEAARLRKPYLYLCHMGVVDFAIPIIVNETYMGAVMGGQILVNDNDRKKLERIVSEQSDEVFVNNEIMMNFHKLPKMPLEKIKALANVIFYVINSYIKDVLSNKSEPMNYNLLIESSPIENTKSYQIVKPAINYIDHNYSNDFTLTDIAKICQISSSYMSRLFKKVVGCNFAHYVNLVRIAHSKKSLVSTNNSIASISMDLGYEDCGYYIKVFKKLEGMTPNEYRNKHSNDNQIPEKIQISSGLNI